MVIFMGHTLLLSCVRLDVDDISYAVVYKERGHFDGAMVLRCKVNATQYKASMIFAPLKPLLNIWRVRAL